MSSTSTHRPYIGVTGFTTAGQIRSAMDAYRSTGITSHVLMCGMLADKTMLQGITPPSPRHVTNINTLISLITAATDAFPVIHYVMFDCEDSFAKDLMSILQPLADRDLPLAVQLNGTPTVEEVTLLRSKFPDLTLLYQVRPELLACGSGAVAQELRRHESGTLSYALIDPSCGTGKDFDIPEVMRTYKALRQKVPDIGIGFAGGLDGANAKVRVQEIQEAIGSDDFSVDAEGKLFTGDLLDAEKTARYLRAAAGGFTA
ncbi:MAG: hypothetical protein HOO67_05285 [Candidatus Peribacteraceae bacterium]|nr:hypothetical protein [Candidatus Peribacteraceae bacterium]